ncbi:MAG: type III-B CRISPR module-associated protein Cmr3 [Desulfobacterales bacterium]|nr:type III-B CRISPR module-associated protein Cmr3 [Desulfobacterales bacterium]
MELFIRPIDTQFYRGGLPFDAGEDVEATMVFPPFPRTLYGALRTMGMISSSGNLSYSNYYGDNLQFGSLYIKGPFLARMDKFKNNTVAFPFPHDLVMQKDSFNMNYLAPVLNFSTDMGWDLDAPDIQMIDQQNQNPPLAGKQVDSLADKYYLPDGSILSQYILNTKLGNFRPRSFWLSNDVVKEEFRTGIYIDNNIRTAKEGMLYRSLHFRFSDLSDIVYGYWIKVEGADPNFPEHGYLKLGGESKVVYFTKLPNNQETSWSVFHKDIVTKILEKIKNAGRFKAYFITPSIFKKGCLPDNCSFSNNKIYLKLTNCNFSFELVSICTTKPIHIGGWDIQKKEPKPIHKAVPAGTVYFFKADQTQWQKLNDNEKENLAKTIYDELNFKTWCSKLPYDGEYGPGKEGFGIPLIGGW